MTPDAWITIAVISACFSVLLLTRYAADMVFVGGVTLLLVLGIVSPAEALNGFANEGLATVAVLYVVAAGMRETGVVQWISRDLLGRPTSMASAQARLMAPVAVLSAFMNNTPVVAMMVPAVTDWAKRNKLNLGELMIPLSYAAIVGGTCTLIGTSTNLVVNGMLVGHGGGSLGMFSLAWVGIPVTIATFLFVLATSRWLLPRRNGPQLTPASAREYVVEMIVQDDSELIGRTIEKAGLRHLPGMYLVELERSGLVMPAVSPQEVLHGGDRLVFAGVVDSVVDLQKFAGLVPATDQVFKLDAPRSARSLVQAVISEHSPVTGRTIRGGRFRNIYGAVIIAVARQGERIKQKIGDIVLQPGDMLLLEADAGFVERTRYNRDFLVVHQLEEGATPKHELRGLAVAILAAMVAVVSAGWLSMLEASLIAGGAMVMSRCLSAARARRAIDLQVLVIIAASLGLGAAMEKTGAADVIAHGVVGLAAGDAFWTLAALFAVTALLTAVISNVAAAVLLFPVAAASAAELGLPLVPFAVILMVAASASFATPTGYQTNLMVYGPGAYRFSDYLRIGLPLTAAVGLVAVLVVQAVWL